MSRLVIVTGLSGSGKTVALHALEDSGYYCIDNLPVALIEVVTKHLTESGPARQQQLALGIDARSVSHDLSDLPEILQRLSEAGLEVRSLFLEATTKVILKRFSETRRRHPLAGGSRPLTEAVESERELLAPFRLSADLVVDTSRRSPHELRELTRHQLSIQDKGLSLCIQSFGFKHGVPLDGDLVFDARCLPNPHWHETLRPLTGKDAAVADFLNQQPASDRLFTDIARFVEDWIPTFEREGRSYLTLCIGCTGGQHRSVYLVERLAARIAEKGLEPLVLHREIG
jgi:RNase adapter protein RapZ